MTEHGSTGARPGGRGWDPLLTIKDVTKRYPRSGAPALDLSADVWP